MDSFSESLKQAQAGQAQVSSFFNGFPVLVFVAAKSKEAGPAIRAVADIADIQIFKGLGKGPHSFPANSDLAASTINIRAFCGSRRGFLKASCSEIGDGPLFSGNNKKLS